MNLENKQIELKEMQEELLRLNKRALNEPDNLNLSRKIASLSNDITKLSSEIEILKQMNDLERKYINKEDIPLHFIDNDRQNDDILLSSNDVNYEKAYLQQKRLLELKYSYINHLPFNYDGNVVPFDNEMYENIYNQLKDEALSLNYVNDVRKGVHFNDEKLNKSFNGYVGKHFKLKEGANNYEGNHFSKPEGAHFSNEKLIKNSNEYVGKHFKNNTIKEENELEKVDFPYVEFIKDGYGYIVGNFTSEYLNQNYKALNLNILNQGIKKIRLINNLSSKPKSVDGLDGVTVRVLRNGNIEVLGDVEHLENHNFSIEKVKDDFISINLDTSTLEGIYNKIKNDSVIQNKSLLNKYLDDYLKKSDEKNTIDEKAREKLYVMMTNKWIHNMASLDISKLNVSTDKSINDYEIIKNFCLSVNDVHNLDEIFSLYEKLNDRLLSKNKDFYKKLIEENDKYGYKADALYRYFCISNIRLTSNKIAALDRKDASNIYIDKNNFGVYSANFDSKDYLLNVRSNEEGLADFIESYISECEKHNINYNITVDVRNFNITFHVSKENLVKNINILNKLATKNKSLVSGVGNINNYVELSSSGIIKRDDILKMAATSLLDNYMKGGQFASKEDALADMKKNDSNYLDKYLDEIRNVCDRNRVDFDTLCFQRGTLEEFLKLDSKAQRINGIDSKDDSGLDIVPEDYLNNIKNSIVIPPKKVTVEEKPVKRKVTRKKSTTLKEKWKNLSTKKKALIIAGIIATVGIGVFVAGPHIIAGISAILNSGATQADTVNQTVNLIGDTVTSAGPNLDYSSISEGHTVFSNAYDAVNNVNGLTSNEWFNSNPIDVFNTATNSYMGLTPEQLNDPTFMAELAKDPNNSLLLGNSISDPSGFVGLDEVVKGGMSR